MTRVAVLDYGSGNIRSAERALVAAGATVEVTTDVSVALAAPGLFVPGVGSFAACMAGLRAIGGDELITERVQLGRPTLAVCVGHQVLFTAGVEHGVQSQGCALFSGVVEGLQATRLPHMGWNTVQPGSESSLFAGIEGERFYFVHSYGVRSADLPDDAVTTWSEHGGDRFLAAVELGPLASTQFHPEKSGPAGARLLRNWLANWSRQDDAYSVNRPRRQHRAM